MKTFGRRLAIGFEVGPLQPRGVGGSLGQHFVKLLLSLQPFNGAFVLGNDSASHILDVARGRVAAADDEALILTLDDDAFGGIRVHASATTVSSAMHSNASHIEPP
jgi:hypothetical protein